MAKKTKAKTRSMSKVREAEPDESADSMIESILEEIGDEVAAAVARWEPFQSPHEGYAVILEEMDELKAHVWTNQTKRDIGRMTSEAIQVAAMAVRFILDVCNEEQGRRPRARE